jgi:macrolide transport system ATP-binding/permease protein
MLASLSISPLTIYHPHNGEILWHLDKLSLSPGWTGIVGRNGSGKTTFFHHLTNQDSSKDFGLPNKIRIEYLSQNLDFLPDSLIDFLDSPNDIYGKWKSIFGINWETFTQWDHLSFGQKRRIQVLFAMRNQPDLLLMDEPSNHLDSVSQNSIIELMKEYSGIGIIISHNRKLLNSLCSSIVFIEQNQSLQISGNYESALLEKQRIEKETLHNYKSIQKENTRLAMEFQRRKQEASLADLKRSKRGLDKNDHGTRGRIDLARVTGKDGKAGRLQNQMKANFERNKNELSLLRNNLPKKENLGIQWNGSTSHRKLFYYREAGIWDFGFLNLSLPLMQIVPNSRIHIKAENGKGKTTILKAIYQELKSNLEENEIYYLPQEISLDGKREIKKSILSLANMDKAKIFQIIHQLDSNSESLLILDSPSEGEWKKLHLAFGILQSPVILLLDEPTNHLDLPSIECLEQILANWNSAMVVISHDKAFIERIGIDEFFRLDNKA